MGESYGGHSGKVDDEGKKREYVAKTMIKWEEDLFDFFDINRVEKTSSYDPKSPNGVSYGIKFRLHSYPQEKDYQYPTEKLRDEKMRLLENKLRNSKVIIT